MKRFLAILVSALIIVCFTLLMAYKNLDLVLSHALSSKFGTQVRVEDVTFTPTTDIEVQNITVANPLAFHSPYALEIGSVYIAAPYENYIKKIIEIDKIIVTNAVLTVEYFNKVTNWETLMAQLDNEDDSIVDDPHSYSVIQELTFINLSVRVAGVDGSYQTYPINKLTLNNIKTKEGELTRRLTQAILNQIIFNFKNIIQIPLKYTQDTIKAPIDTTIDGLKSLNPFGK